MASIQEAAFRIAQQLSEAQKAELEALLRAVRETGSPPTWFPSRFREILGEEMVSAAKPFPTAVDHSAALAIAIQGIVSLDIPKVVKF